MKLFTFSVVSVMFLYGVIEGKFRNKLNSDVINALKSKETLNIVVYFGPFNKSTFGKNFNTFDMKISLISNAAKSQKRVQEFLMEESMLRNGIFTFKGFWIANVVIIRNAPDHLIRSLEDFEEIHSIFVAEKVELIKPVSRKISTSVDEIQWGVKVIGAPEAWKKGYNGSGIIVGSIDTGARATHSSLRDNYVGTLNYGWYDPVGHVSEPEDLNGHGTHTIGTMVGRGGIGVAPEAKWMSCRAFDPFGGGELEDIVSCMEFMACPHDQSGENYDCSKAPHLISNSWGSYGQSFDFLRDIIDIYHFIGIIPVFSIGNDGYYGCESVGYPGGFETVIGVGSTDKQDTLSSFSSLGPSRWTEEVKPEIVAPGENVVSASHKSDHKYVAFSGTSMAAPHASGAIGILLQKDPTLEFDDIRNILQKSAFNKVRVEGDDLNCGAIPVTTIPNHNVGYGRINVHDSLELVKGN